MLEVTQNFLRRSTPHPIDKLTNFDSWTSIRVWLNNTVGEIWNRISEILEYLNTTSHQSDLSMISIYQGLFIKRIDAVCFNILHNKMRFSLKFSHPFLKHRRLIGLIDISRIMYIFIYNDKNMLIKKTHAQRSLTTISFPKMWKIW